MQHISGMLVLAQLLENWSIMEYMYFPKSLRFYLLQGILFIGLMKYQKTVRDLQH